MLRAFEDSQFFNHQFDGVVGWGLMFLLPAGAWPPIIAKSRLSREVAA